MNKAKLVRELVDSGLSEKESALYIAAVQKHIFTLAEISKLSGIKRTTCYSVIESLLAKNYIATVPDNRFKRYVAVDPTAIAEREHSKMKSLDQAMEFMSQIRNTATGHDVPHIELFYGVEGLKQIYSTILRDCPENIYSIANTDYLAKYVNREFLYKWRDQRVKNRIKQNAMQNPLYDKDKDFLTDKKFLREVRYLPETFTYETMYYVWDNKVGFISTKREGINFIITSTEYAKLHKAQFDFMWNSLKVYE